MVILIKLFKSLYGEKFPIQGWKVWFILGTSFSCWVDTLQLTVQIHGLQVWFSFTFWVILFFFFMIFKPQLSSWLITGFLTFRFGHFKGSYFRVVSCFLLPAIQLVVGISHPSWVSLPFFICSCVGLVDWSLTSNFSGLFRYCCGSSSHYQFYYLDGLFFFFF